MASRRRFYGKDKKKLKFGKNGRPLCRYCEQEVKPPKRTFCSKECVHEWKLRRSSSYVRQCLLKRDGGVCVICKRDTVALKKEGKRILKDHGKSAYWDFAKKLGFPPERKSWFDADHIIPVCQGGGECGLENYRVLCVTCHKSVTKELQRKLSFDRKYRKATTGRKKRNAIPLPPPEAENPSLYRRWQQGKL